MGFQMFKVISESDEILVIEFHGRNLTILKEPDKLSIYVDSKGKRPLAYVSGINALFHPDNYQQLGEIKQI